MIPVFVQVVIITKIPKGRYKNMNEKQNRRLMHLIRRVHGFLESDDIQKQRDAQNQIAGILVNGKKYQFTPFEVNGMYCEWVEYLQNKELQNKELQNKDVQDDPLLIFYCHGGGYMTGSCLYAREITSKLSELNNCRVFSFNYRLAPENPYPAALEDAFTAWDYILSCGYRPGQTIVAGDSAGGNMALALTLLLKEKKLALPKGIVLFSPWTDMTASGSSYRSKELLDPVLTNAYIQKATNCYLNGESPKNPFVSPLFGDLSGFPPVYIQAGDNEILLDDSCMLYEQLLKCGVYAKLDIFPGMWHVFQLSPVSAARKAMGKAHDFITDLSAVP